MLMSNNFDIIEALWLRRERKRRAQKTIEGAPPLTYTAKNAGTLKNYRIYGQTSRNLFDGKFLQGYWAYADGVWMQSNTWIATKKIPCKSSTTYTFSFNRASRWYGFVWFDFSGNCISSNNQQSDSNMQYHSFSATSPPNAAYMVIDVAGYPDYSATISPNDITDFMLVENSTPLPYEPYGESVGDLVTSGEHAGEYKVPVTVSDGTDTLTTPIYLPEQIRKVGDEAEYIDYAEQKQHFADGTSVDVTLPALPTVTGTNVLSVGTGVQPSSVKIEGKIKGVS